MYCGCGCRCVADADVVVDAVVIVIVVPHAVVHVVSGIAMCCARDNVCRAGVHTRRQPSTNSDPRGVNKIDSRKTPLTRTTRVKNQPLEVHSASRPSSTPIPGLHELRPRTGACSLHRLPDLRALPLVTGFHCRCWWWWAPNRRSRRRGRRNMHISRSVCVCMRRGRGEGAGSPRTLHRARARDGGGLSTPFLLPRTAPVVHLVLLGVAHHDDLAAQSLLAFLDQHREFIADPVHLHDNKNTLVRHTTSSYEISIR